MLAKFRAHHPSPAMGVALVALFVALGGTSYAVATGSIDSREIRDNTVRGKDIRNDTIQGKDVANRTLGASDVATGSLTGGNVRDNSLSGFDIAPNSVSGDELVRNSVGATELRPNSIDADELRDGGIGFFDLFEGLLNPVIRVAKETVPNNTTTTDVAGCTAGERAIAGGYGTADDLQSGVAVLSDGPTSFVSGSENLGGIATAWRVRIRNTTGSALELTSFVTCVRR